MNENIDLRKILKDLPKGTKLYSPIFGEVDFERIGSDDEYAIFITKGDINASFTKEGFYYADFGEECLLLPSKDQRDWSKFTAPWYKKERFNPKTLKPFDRVIVRDDNDYEWVCTIFSHQGEDYAYPYNTASGAYVCCIPYNDDTKHLVGTKEEAPEYYKYWEN